MQLRSARAVAAAALVIAAFAALGALAACKGKGNGKDPGPAAEAGIGSGGGGGAGAAATPARDPRLPGLDQLSVTFAGKPVAIERAFVKRMEPDRYQLYLSNSGGTCEELIDNAFDARGRIDVLATIAPRLNADGKRYLEVTDVHEGAPTMIIARDGRVAIRGDGGAGEPVEISIALRAQAKENPRLTIEVSGTFTAMGCGARARDTAGIPRAEHPTGATLTLANQRLELKGAIVRGRGKDRDVLLSTGPKDCSSSTPWAAVILERTGGRWRAHGTWLAEELVAAEPGGRDEATRQLRVGVGAAGTSEDGPTAKLELSGTGVLGGFALGLEGWIEAIVCPAEPSDAKR